MKRLLLLLILGLFLISLASSQDCPAGIQGQSYPLIAVCDNCTNVNFTKVIYPNGSIASLGDFNMTKNNTNYNYTFTKTQTLGTYNYVTCGDLDGILTCEDTTNRCFEITPNGIRFSTQNSIFYVALLGLLVFLFVLNAIAISKLPHGNPRSDKGNILSVSLLKYLKPTLVVVGWGLIISLLFIASGVSKTYLMDSSISSFLFGLFRIATVIIYPLIFFSFIWIIVNIFKDKKLKDFFDRGYSPV